MRSYLFTFEAFVAISLVLFFLGSLYTNYIPRTGLQIYKVAQDSLAILRYSGILKTQNPVLIEAVLNKTAPHHRLEIYKYTSSNTLASMTIIGEDLGKDTASTAEATFVDSQYFYKAVLGVWP